MLSYDECKSIRSAKRIAVELGLDPSRRGTTRLARNLSDLASVREPTDAACPRPAMLTGEGFTLARDAAPPLQNLAVTTLRDAVPVVRWLNYVPAVAGLTDLTDGEQHDILGPVE